MRYWMIAVCILAMTGCGRRAQDSSAPDSAQPPLSELSPREALVDCAGAIVAHTGLDPLADPSLNTPEENAYFVVLALMDREPGLEGTAGRKAAAASRDAWLNRSAEQRATRAGECLKRFPG